MPVEVRTITVGPLEVNCYIVRDVATGACAIIDPGGDCDRIVSALGFPFSSRMVSSEECSPSLSSSERENEGEVAGEKAISIQWILLTHGHFDHTFCAGVLADKYGARVGMHESDLSLLGQTLGVAEMFYNFNDYTPVKPTDLLHDGQTINLGESEIKVIHTPGHSPGGLSFLTEAGVFCGDAVFAGSIGRTDFPGGSFAQLVGSIKSKLLVLPDSTKLYPGHGPATTVGRERMTNPYLR